MRNGIPRRAIPESQIVGRLDQIQEQISQIWYTIAGIIPLDADWLEVSPGRYQFVIQDVAEDPQPGRPGRVVVICEVVAPASKEGLVLRMRFARDSTRAIKFARATGLDAESAIDFSQAVGRTFAAEVEECHFAPANVIKSRIFSDAEGAARGFPIHPHFRPH